MYNSEIDITNNKLDDLLSRYIKLSNEYKNLNEKIEIQRNDNMLDRLNSKILDIITEMKIIQNELDRRGIRNYNKIFV